LLYLLFSLLFSSIYALECMVLPITNIKFVNDTATWVQNFILYYNTQAESGCLGVYILKILPNFSHYINKVIRSKFILLSFITCCHIHGNVSNLQQNAYYMEPVPWYVILFGTVFGHNINFTKTTDL
jgi:hypothetical protein